MAGATPTPVPRGYPPEGTTVNEAWPQQRRPRAPRPISGAGLIPLATPRPGFVKASPRAIPLDPTATFEMTPAEATAFLPSLVPPPTRRGPSDLMERIGTPAYTAPMIPPALIRPARRKPRHSEDILYLWAGMLSLVAMGLVVAVHLLT